MDKTPIIRLNYTKHPQGLSRCTIEEWKTLDHWSCPCCTVRTEFDRTEYDIVGGKYLAYVVHYCTACGWWNAFKYWEDRSGEIIHAVNRNEPVLEKFDLASKEAQLDIVLQVIRRNYGDLQHLHWTLFQRLVQQMLYEKGFSSTDISRKRSSGGDLLAIDVEGNKYLVEVKHVNYRPVGLDVVQRLKGAIQDTKEKHLKKGLIVVSKSFSRDALESMGVLRGKESTRSDNITVTGMDFLDIVDWIKAREQRSIKEVLETLRYFHFGDAMSEQ